MSVSPTDIRLELEFSSGIWSDVWADVRTVDTVSMDRGIRGNLPTDRCASVGTISFSLDNSISNSGSVQGYYSPGHGSCRSGFDLGLAGRLAIDYGGTTYLKFYGILTSIEIIPGSKGKQTTQCTLSDFMHDCQQHRVNLMSAQTARRSDLFLGDVVDNMGPAPLSRSFGTGQETFAYVGDDLKDEKTTALAVMQKIAMSEFGYIYMAGSNYDDGALVDAAYLTRCEDTVADVLTRLTPVTSGALVYTDDLVYDDKYGSYAAQTGRAITNQCKNPIFESNVTDGWDFDDGTGNVAVASQETTIKKFGSGAAKIVADNTSESFLYMDADYALADGETIIVGAWAYATTAANCEIRIRDTTNAADRATINPTGTGAWEFITCKWTNSTGLAANVHVRLVNEATDGAEACYFDCVHFIDANYLDPLCVGSLGTGHSWAGDAHNSTSSRTATSWAVTKSLPSNFSFGFWVQPIALEGDYDADVVIFEWYGDVNDYIKLIVDHTNNNVEVVSNRNGTTKTVSATADQWTRHTWIHYIVTFDGTTLTLYQDGSSVGTPATSLGTHDTTPTAFYVGADNGDANHANVLFDDVFVLNYALTTAQASALQGAALAIADASEYVGILTFQNRHARVSNLTSVATISDTMTQLSVKRDIQQCFNFVRATAYPREIGASAETLFTLQATPEIAAGATETIIARYTDPSNRDVRIAGVSLWDPEGKNEITDAGSERGFESGTTGWAAAGTDTDAIAQSSTQAKLGTYSQKLTSGTGAAHTNFTQCGPYTGFAQNDIVYAQAWVYLEEAWPANVELCISEYDAAHAIGTTTVVSFIDKNSTAAWYRLHGTHTCVDADCSELKVHVGVVSANADFSGGAVDCYIDEVYLIDDANMCWQFSSSAGGSGDLNDYLILHLTEQGGNSCKFILENTGTSSGFITSLLVKGLAVRLYEPSLALAEDSTSQGLYGKNELILPLAYQDNVMAAQDWANISLAKWKDPVNRAQTVSFYANRDATHMTAALAREIGNRITLSETVTSFSSQVYFINSIQYRIKAPDTILCVWGLTEAGAEQYWLMGTAGASEAGETTIFGF